MPDFKVTIEIKDVADGDIAWIVEDMLNTYGVEWDVGRGEFQISVAKKEGRNYFPVNTEDLKP